ncbi:hypothetical protein ACH46_00090 [Gordonia phthalatica]|uniref:Uncharacterized protein n=2 Tax=Gordonia phthalatica TaxID=1136941 RepID=A0A0N7FU28_9ACTN|nr:hypothetical protein ACH46_00090 [Gordonia phthalatica]
MRKLPTHAPASAPVSMPVIRLTVHGDGTMSATVDGEPLTPPSAEGVWRRGSFARIVDQVTADRMIPARVEVTEADGSTFTDIITATARKHTPAPAPPVPELAERPRLREVTGEGFVPGEDVAVCRIIRHTDATGTGAARALIDLARDHLDPGDDVVLIGRFSGTLVVRSLS